MQPQSPLTPDRKKRLSSPYPSASSSPNNPRRYTTGSSSSPASPVALSLTGSSSSARVFSSDRFIPSRDGSNLEEALDILDNAEMYSGRTSSTGSAMSSLSSKLENQEQLNSILRLELLGQHTTALDRTSGSFLQSPSRPTSVFKYTYGSPGSNSLTRHSDPLLGPRISSPFHADELASHSAKKATRKIPKVPYKVLDAPSLQDDFYLNLLDWSSNNVLSVALGTSVYLWSACTSKVIPLCDLGPDDSVTSLCWSQRGDYLAIGGNSGTVSIWDISAQKVVREFRNHASRVGVMCWNSSLLASGSRDRHIYVHDARVRSRFETSASYNTASSSSPSRLTVRSAIEIEDDPDVYLDVDDMAIDDIRTDRAGRNSMSGAATPPDEPNVILPDSPPVAATSGALATDSPQAQVPHDRSIFSSNPFHPPHRWSLSSGLQRNDNNSSRMMSPQSLFANGLASVGTATAGDPSIAFDFNHHKQEVCGLKWSFDEKMLASGGNDNKLMVWSLAAASGATSNDPQSTGDDTAGSRGLPLYEFSDHNAAVKAVAWSPHQHGLLASGGGTADRHIRFWNTSTGFPLHKIDTGSQVCNLMWSKNVNELVSTHGYSLNQVIVWKYPSMQKLATLTGHTFRVLYLAMSPDGQSIVTGAGDESLRFWNVFPKSKSRSGLSMGPSLLLPTGTDIR